MAQDYKALFDHVEKRLDAITENMFTKADAEAMRGELAHKHHVDQILTSVDGIAKQMTT